jgi:DNA polymerase-1
MWQGNTVLQRVVEVYRLGGYVTSSKCCSRRGREWGLRPKSTLTRRATHHACEGIVSARTKAGKHTLNYGMRENKLGRAIKKSKEEALKLMNQYMDRYPAVKRFYAEAIQETLKTKRTYTVLGRRRYLPEIYSDHRMDRGAAERKAVNTQIQGSAADVVRLAMINIDQLNLEEALGCRMLLQIHDELVFECPADNVDEALAVIKSEMENPLPSKLDVPLDVTIGKGLCWSKAK